MKYYSRLKVYKASNVVYDPIEETAYSYSWWRFVERINGILVFNNDNYSSATCRHQRKVRSLLNELGIKIDLFIEAPAGLQNLKSAIDNYKYLIKVLEAKIAKPKTHKAKNLERQQTIAEYRNKIEQIDRLTAINEVDSIGNLVQLFGA